MVVRELFDVDLLLVDLDGDSDELDGRALATVRRLPCVTIGLGVDDGAGVPAGEPLGAELDIVFDREVDLLDQVVAGVEASPMASRTLVQLLRAGEGHTVEVALVEESLAYSMLLASREFAAWLAARTPRAPKPDQGDVVLLERRETELCVTLNRPHVHNAYSASMRDALVAALAVAEVDGSVARVLLRGAGPSFCSGGDLDEFGTAGDPAAAHVVRTAQSGAAAIHRLRERTTAHVHGACVGAGVELPAFAGHVIAHPGATFRLPEIAMGLIPGAGGTVSLPRRIGRQRTALLALSGAAVGADLARAWGLVDAIAEADGRTG
jgi:enoyl-CoA hydratase/carnithine racemase